MRRRHLQPTAQTSDAGWDETFADGSSVDNCYSFAVHAREGTSPLILDPKPRANLAVAAPSHTSASC